MIHYFAYGSNLHPVRLRERVPSADLLGVVERPAHRLAFHKRSHDGSAKCNLFHTASESDRVYGAIYRLDPGQKKDLDRHEGSGKGYRDAQVRLRHQGRTYSCFT